MPRRKTPTFEEFWAAYPVHKRRIDAERAWKRMTVKDKLAAMDGIAAYRDECLRTGIAICFGQGYLNGRRWEDEPDTTRDGAGAARGNARGGTGSGTPAPPPPSDEMETW